MKILSALSSRSSRLVKIATVALVLLRLTAPAHAGLVQSVLVPDVDLFSLFLW